MNMTLKFLIVLFALQGYSQRTSKEEILFDEEWNPISLKDFYDKIKDKKLTYKLTENDTSYLGKIFLREELGNISPQERIALLTYLEELTSSTIDSIKTIVINFYFKPARKPNGSCIDYYTSDNRYKRYFRKNDKNIQFFITEKGYDYKKDFVFEDKDALIRNLLFKYNFDCGNYIIIKPNGRFLRRLGEYRQFEIRKKLDINW
ncbi:hypothetical protein [Aquimarina sp. 2201CG14-23]|uniref:hypothetical protein n=1 Tax=Aquimarina mycalae TaxID=3040073 RepID=UPI002477EB1C|nr:hypothetical protein [Aquimarina sp. 2201CG14-23]MDH7446349.1 hypothetical protein [Aquimarina sp. 2201CG14-23]